MSFTLNGTGTICYGKTPLPDGSYVTTEWIAVLFVPIIPICSLRVLSVGEGRLFFPIYARRSMKAVRVPLNKRQVVFTDLIAVVLVLVVVALLRAAKA
jgi:hypothetical protein